MRFTKIFLQDMEGKTISDDIVDHTQWSVLHRRVFEFENKFYETYYSVGVTENPSKQPYEYSAEKIQCIEVFPVEKIVTAYQPLTKKEKNDE